MAFDVSKHLNWYKEIASLSEIGGLKEIIFRSGDAKLCRDRDDLQFKNGLFQTLDYISVLL